MMFTVNPWPFYAICIASLQAYKRTNRKIVQSSTDMDVRRKARSIVFSMTSSQNIEDVVLFLKRQLQRAQEREFQKAPEYRQLLIQLIHALAVKFSEVAASVVHALMQFLGDLNNPSVLDVVAFICGREVPTPPAVHMRQAHSEIKSGKAFRGVLWILGEYVESLSDIQATFQDICKVFGEIPIFASEQRLLDEAGGEEDKKEDKVEGSGRPNVLADGTYATVTAYTSADSARLEVVKAASKPPLRGSVFASALMKLALQFDDLTDDWLKANALRAEFMLIMMSIIHVGPVEFYPREFQEKSIVHDIFLKDTKAAYSKMLVAQEVHKKAAEKKESESTKKHVVQVDDLLTFRQFLKKSADDLIDYFEDLGKATGAAEVQEDFIYNLGRIPQLTGFSDPTYVEAYVKMHGFDIMTCFLVNQAPNTLQNICLDIPILGDLKLVERPAVYTIAPRGFQSIKATIKPVVSSKVDVLQSILPGDSDIAAAVWDEVHSFGDSKLCRYPASEKL
ncbi:coatomer beta C-terminal region-domain-containing protein [Suillus discolor]|uniref:Coatomer beta C-terminal region-domain-containing protein n=1 Tax=Suillus discolor TaxID=1912936 RepID=A0A9P7EXC4_9AGAM|nr:coatomer beta C-terminal region-domain-containing protein [Suillus discolor]KAG2093746.1 coatomer beta C-terminal region-domain-containing protein [Suillus discolor]